MARYYIDTCIWRDYLEYRSDKWRPLGEWAGRLFNKIVSEGSEVIISDLLLKELNLSEKDLKFEQFLEIVPKELILFVVTERKHKEMEKDIVLKYKIPKSDALHAIFAIENQAIFVSRDKHFIGIKNLNIVKPEELI